MALRVYFASSGRVGWRAAGAAACWAAAVHAEAETHERLRLAQLLRRVVPTSPLPPCPLLAPPDGTCFVARFDPLRYRDQPASRAHKRLNVQMWQVGWIN